MTCLPGLLALEDATTGRLGFLSRWSGLNKLQRVRGSLFWTTTEARKRVGELEIEWFATHLPALKYAAFVEVPFSEVFMDKIPAPLKDLHRRRPDIILDYVFKQEPCED